MGISYGITSLGAGTPSSGKYEVGMFFTVGASDINVTGLRIYTPATQTVNAHLWRASDSALIGTASISGTANAWSEGNLASPVTLVAGATYAVSVYVTANGNAWYYNKKSTDTFNSAITIGSSAFNGSANTYPIADSATSIYGFVDIIIDDGGGAGATFPNVNIGGEWKNVESMSVNIGGTWKNVESTAANIGGAWKELSS